MSKLSANTQGGYIALMSAIIIAGVLMVVVFSMSFKGFMTRFNLLDSEYKKRSLNLAEACANTAVLKVIENSSYTGGEAITVNGENCSIVSVVVSGSQYIIRSSAVVQEAVSNVEITLNSDFSLARWEEVPNF